MRILLNITKRGNFVFFDPVNKIHLNRVNPMGIAKELSPALKRAIIAGNVIDVDNSFGVKVQEIVEKLNEKVLRTLNVVRVEKTVVEKEETPKIIIEEKVEIIEEVKEEIKEEAPIEKPKKKTTKKQVK